MQTDHLFSWMFGIESPRIRVTFDVRASVAKKDKYLSVNRMG